MKILYVELSVLGHRKKYIQTLINNSNRSDECIVLCPKKCVKEIECKNIEIISCDFNKKRTLKNYYKLIKDIEFVGEKYNVDIIHFLEADEYYRFFGFLLRKIARFKIVMTFHHVYTYGWRKYAIKNIFSKICMGVVHTEYIKNYFKDQGIDNIEHIEYPVFNSEELLELNINRCKKYFHLPLNVPIIGTIGATNRYKGLKILLEALKEINEPFHLLIAGKEVDTIRGEIESYIVNYKSNVTLELRNLTDEEYRYAIVASDIIALPYLKEFNGASGPLADGVVVNKIIVGSNYGSLGDIVSKNNLGLTFEVENSADLKDKLIKIIRNAYEYDNKSSKYKKLLDPFIFNQKYIELYKKLVRN